MASLWKHPDSPYWTACFTARDGRQLKRSTKTKDRKLAQKLAEQFEEAAKLQRTARQARQVIADLHKRITGDSLVSQTVREYVVGWLARKAPETAPATMKFYTYCTTKFLTWLGIEADKDIALVSREQITRFRNEEARTLSAKTVNHNVKCLRMLFRAAKQDGFLGEDPAEFVDAVNSRILKAAGKRRPFTKDQLRAVLGACDDEWRSMVLFGLYTGQRLGDLAQLTWAQLNLTEGIVQLTTAKTGKEMQIPIADPLNRHIETLSAPDAKPEECFIHPKLASIGQRNGTGHLSGIFSNILASAGLRAKQPHRVTGKPRAKNALSFHSLRHTAVTMLKEAGIPAAVVMEMIGHDSEQMSQHYTHVGKEAMEKAAKSMPDLTST